MIPTLKHYSDIVSDISSGSVYGIFILTFYLTFFLAYIMTFFLKFNLFGIYSNILSCISSDILSGILSDIFGNSVRSRSAGITLIQRLLFGSGGDHCAHEFLVEVRWGTFLIPLASEVRRGTGRVRQGLLRSRACKWGPVPLVWLSAEVRYNCSIPPGPKLVHPQQCWWQHTTRQPTPRGNPAITPRQQPPTPILIVDFGLSTSSDWPV